jgi:hypothetical protein
MVSWNKVDETQLKQLINSNIKVNKDNKIKKGEVFTPYFIIKDMLDLYPKEIWTNPNLTWLEPGSGFGGFTICVFYRLLNGLKKFEPDFTKRKNHILKNMLFMVEISPENVKKCKQILGNNINICNCDFFDVEKWSTQFNVILFDNIIGNPPFNKDGMRGKGRKNKGFKNIWSEFIKISLELLSKDGYLCFFTPNSWTELKSNISKRMMEKQLLYYRNYDVFIAYKIFDKDAGSMPLCYYLLQNKNTKNNTEIYDKLTNKYVSYNIYDSYVIPTMNIELIKKVLKTTHKVGSLENDFYFTPPKVKSDTTKYSSSFSKKFCFPLINFVHKKIVLSYSCEKSKLQNLRPKLLFPNYSMGYPILDREGILDVGGRSSYVIYLDNNKIQDLKLVQKLFLTPLVFAIINSLKTAQKFLSTRTFDIVPNLTNTEIDFDVFDSEKLYKFLNLTQKEIDGVQFQLTDGEGNLTDELKQKILDFHLSDHLSKTNYNYILKEINKYDNDEIIKKRSKRSLI